MLLQDLSLAGKETWPDNSLRSRPKPAKFQQPAVVTRPTTARPPATTTTTRTTTTTTTTTTVATTTVRLGRVLVQELEMDPYLSIDMARFPVLAAVPGEGDQPAAVTGRYIVPGTDWWCYLLCKPHKCGH